MAGTFDAATFAIFYDEALRRTRDCNELVLAGRDSASAVCVRRAPKAHVLPLVVLDELRTGSGTLFVRNIYLQASLP